jgi:antitoxin (DNA-binding transcriptional repressor) of toxin-antitoxin stability system
MYALLAHAQAGEIPIAYYSAPGSYKQLDNLTKTIYHISMITMQVGKLKTNFSEVLQKIRTGEKIAISYGKKKEKIAVLIPFSEYSKKQSRTLGLLQNKASMNIHNDFAMSDEELMKG